MVWNAKMIGVSSKDKSTGPIDMSEYLCTLADYTSPIVKPVPASLFCTLTDYTQPDN